MKVFIIVLRIKSIKSSIILYDSLYFVDNKNSIFFISIILLIMEKDKGGIMIDFTTSKAEFEHLQNICKETIISYRIRLLISMYKIISEQTISKFC